MNIIKINNFMKLIFKIVNLNKFINKKNFKTLYCNLTKD